MRIPDPEPFTEWKAEHGEGPLWDPVKQQFYWVDIMQGQFYRADLETEKPDIFAVGTPLGVLSMRERGGLVLAVERSFAFFDPEQGTLEYIEHAPLENLSEVRMNDGAVDPMGRFFAGTMDYQESRPVGHLYCLDIDSSVRILEKDLCITNGMAWSEDYRYFYLIDTPTHTIFRYNYDPTTGTISHKSPFKIFGSNQYPDGMTMDAEGGFWVAMWGESRVIHLDNNGREIESIALPVPHVTSCCFGGPEMNILFITTSRKALNASEQAKFPLAGRTFTTLTQQRGRFETQYKG